MAGHSKWANIKHKKEANDAKRSAVFTKMTKLITSAVQEGGGIPDPENNFKLRLAVERAKSANMPKDNIQRAIDRASGESSEKMSDMLYEGFGPGGAGLLIAATTDNPNRTHTEVKTALDKNGGKIGSQNSVAYQFDQCGVVEFASKDISEEDAFTFFDEINGIDFEKTDDSYIVYIPFESIGKVKNMTDVKPKTLDIFYKPQVELELSDEDMKKLDKIIDQLEDLDDVLNVYSNA